MEAPLKRAIATVLFAIAFVYAASSPWPLVESRSDTTVVITAAGDICSAKPKPCTKTAAEVLSVNPAVALTLGDNQYPKGALASYLASYDLEWGQFKAVTKPAPGNHEWKSGRAGYDAYFGSQFLSPGGAWYSFDVGDWHLISLDSNCSRQGGCKPGSPVYTFLANDLATDQHLCTLAYWHHPRFSSGTEHGSNLGMRPLWDLLYADGAELVLNGHEHNYERFAPQTPTGAADPVAGITEFVIGTGGRGGNYPFGTPIPNSVVRIRGFNGIGVFALSTSGWTMQFVGEDGVVRDTASGTCH